MKPVLGNTRDDLDDLAREIRDWDFQEKTQRNFRVKSRYDELMREGKHGHYESMFRVVHEEIARERRATNDAIKSLAP